MITIELDNKTNPRGPGFWKLNTLFLLESEHVSLISKTITEVANEYSNIHSVDAVLLLDTMKMKIRAKSLEYTKRKKKKDNSEEQLLELDIRSLNERLEQRNIPDCKRKTILNQIEVKTIRREKICQYKTRGSIIRSKTRWYNEGEKNTKYFLNLEKKTP